MINTNYDYSQNAYHPSAYLNYYNQNSQIGSQVKLTKEKKPEKFVKKTLKYLGKLLPCLPEETSTLERGLTAFFLILALIIIIVVVLALIPVYRNFGLKNDKFPVQIADALKQNDSQLFRIITTAAQNRSIEDNNTLSSFLTDLKDQLTNKTLTKLSDQLDQVTDVIIEPENNGTIAISFSALTKPITPAENEELQKLIDSLAKNSTIFDDIVISNNKMIIESVLAAADTVMKPVQSEDKTPVVIESESSSSESETEGTSTVIPAEKAELEANRPNIEFKPIELIEGKPIISNKNDHKQSHSNEGKPVMNIQKPFIQYGPAGKPEEITIPPQVATDKDFVILNLTPFKPSIEDKEIKITPQKDFIHVPNKEELAKEKKIVDDSYRPIAKQQQRPMDNEYDDEYNNRPPPPPPPYMNNNGMNRPRPPQPYYENNNNNYQMPPRDYYRRQQKYRPQGPPYYPMNNQYNNRNSYNNNNNNNRPYEIRYRGIFDTLKRLNDIKKKEEEEEAHLRKFSQDSIKTNGRSSYINILNYNKS